MIVVGSGVGSLGVLTAGYAEGQEEEVRKSFCAAPPAWPSPPAPPSPPASSTSSSALLNTADLESAAVSAYKDIILSHIQSVTTSFSELYGFSSDFLHAQISSLYTQHDARL